MLLTQKRHEYRNDFIYFAVSPAETGGQDALMVCSGVNLTRFSPVTRGRYGIGGNPILSGLQLIKYEVCALALSKGATPREVRGDHCDVISPTKEAWYSEALLIENAASLAPEELISFGVGRLTQKIVACSRLGFQVPREIPSAEELQVYLETLCGAMPKAA